VGGEARWAAGGGACVSAGGREHRRRGGPGSKPGRGGHDIGDVGQRRGAAVKQGHEHDGNGRGGCGAGGERGGGACPGTPRWRATRPAQEPPD
jgi:hypothetical protein